MAVQKRKIWGWMSFDWASQPFFTLGLTFIFGPYFASVMTDSYMAGGLTEDASEANAQSLWSLTQMLAGFFIALSAPLLGAYADSTGRRTPWLIAFSITFVLGSWALWYMVPDGSNVTLCLIAFIIAFVSVEFSGIFVNAELPSLGTKAEIGRISGSGAAFGYWGGVVSLVIMLLFFYELTAGKTLLGQPPAFGLDGAASEGTRAVGPFIAIWYVLFMIPYFLFVRDDRSKYQSRSFSQTWGDLKGTLQRSVKRPSLLAFLLGSMFYRDALNALYAFGGVYAELVLDWALMNIAIFGIISAIMAAIITYFGGRLDKRFGPKPVIIGCVWVLIGVCVTIISMTKTTVFGFDVSGVVLYQGANFTFLIPDLLMYICGAAIGGAGGVLYAASRSLMVRHTDPDRPTEAFGLFALSGKATAFLAPGLIAVFTYVLRDARLGFSPVILLFIAGLVLLRWVQPEGDKS